MVRANGARPTQFCVHYRISHETAVIIDSVQLLDDVYGLISNMHQPAPLFIIVKPGLSLAA